MVCPAGLVGDAQHTASGTCSAICGTSDVVNQFPHGSATERGPFDLPGVISWTEDADPEAKEAIREILREAQKRIDGVLRAQEETEAVEPPVGEREER